MKPLSWDKQLGLASPLKCAANQSGQTNNPSKDKNEVGLDVSHHIHLAPEGRGKYFFLDIPSHRMSEMAMSRQLRNWAGRDAIKNLPKPCRINVRHIDAVDLVNLRNELLVVSRAMEIP